MCAGQYKHPPRNHHCKFHILQSINLLLQHSTVHPLKSTVWYCLFSFSNLLHPSPLPCPTIVITQLANQLDPGKCFCILTVRSHVCLNIRSLAFCTSDYLFVTFFIFKAPSNTLQSGADQVMLDQPINLWQVKGCSSCNCQGCPLNFEEVLPICFLIYASSPLLQVYWPQVITRHDKP